MRQEMILGRILRSDCCCEQESMAMKEGRKDENKKFCAERRKNGRDDLQPQKQKQQQLLLHITSIL